MKIIEAFQCEWCDKVYSNRETEKSHERKCFHNPRTKSCASCVFLAKKTIEAQRFLPIEFLFCLMNHDITDKLRTGCPTYNEAILDEDTRLKTNLPPTQFDEKLALERLAPRLEAMREQIEKGRAQKTRE